MATDPYPVQELRLLGQRKLNTLWLPKAACTPALGEQNPHPAVSSVPPRALRARWTHRGGAPGSFLEVVIVHFSP